MFMNMRKKAAMCDRNPSNTMGSRPYLLVLFPSKPNAAPPDSQERHVLVILSTSNGMHSCISPRIQLT